MKLENLASNILAINSCLKDSVTKAINKHVTSRNWLTGYCIVEYEQNGEDRAKYGERILQSLAERLDDEGLSYRNLKLYRQFYLTYPQLDGPIGALSYTHLSRRCQSTSSRIPFLIRARAVVSQT